MKEPMVLWDSATASTYTSSESDLLYIGECVSILEDPQITAKYSRVTLRDLDSQDLYEISQELEGLVGDKGFLTTRYAGDWSLYAPLPWAQDHGYTPLVSGRHVFEREDLLDADAP